MWTAPSCPPVMTTSKQLAPCQGTAPWYSVSTGARPAFSGPPLQSGSQFRLPWLLPVSGLLLMEFTVNQPLLSSSPRSSGSFSFIQLNSVLIQGAANLLKHPLNTLSALLEEINWCSEIPSLCVNTFCTWQN